MQHEQATEPRPLDASKRLPRWSISHREIEHDQSARRVLTTETRSLSSNPHLVTCAAPVASLWFGLGKGLNSLKPFRNLRELELPSAFQPNLLPVLYQLRRFPHLEDLTLRSGDITRPRWTETFASNGDTAKPFCDFSKLKRLILNDVKVDQLFFTWLAEAINLERLEFKDMSFEGDMNSLRKLASLRHLEIKGCCDNFSSLLSFISCFPRLKDLSVEMGAPDEEDLRLLSKCSAHIHLKLRRCYHPGQIEAICEIHNLKSLTLSTPFGFKIPRGFKALRKLTSLGFIDEGDAFNEIKGFQNVPTSLRTLSLDLDSPNESRLSRVLSGLTTQLTSLSLKQKFISTASGLEQNWINLIA